MTANVLAIDLGTTGVKVALVDESGSVLARAGEVLQLAFTRDGGVEQNPNDWWSAIGRCSRRAVEAAAVTPDDVSLIAITSQYTSTVAVDAAGLPLANAIMWLDGRGRRHNRAAGAGTDTDRWYEVHGLAPSGNDDIGHVSFIRDEWPDVYATAHAFVEPMDAVAARLTGLVTATQNTMFPMLVVDNRVWGSMEYSDELLVMSGMDADKLPKLVPLGQPRGKVTAEAAAHLGVSVDAVVMDATIDSVTSSVGTGVVDADGCGLVIGTTSVVATHVGSKRQDPAHGLTTAPSPLPGMYFLVAENGLGGKALDVFVNQIVFADDGLGATKPADAYEKVLAAAATAPPGSEGVMFFPWLIGAFAPSFERRVRGGFVNVSLTTSRVDMARAVLEGVALNVSWLLPHFAALADRSYPEISLGGGGAASPLWGQILADCTGIAVRRLANSTTTNAHGAALLALVDAGVIGLRDVASLVSTIEVHEPDPGNHRLYRRLLPLFIDFLDRSAPFYEQLNAPHGTPSDVP